MADVDASLDTCHARKSTDDTKMTPEDRFEKLGIDSGPEHHHCTCLDEPVSDFGISCRKSDCAKMPADEAGQ
ncbi:hypothetical protein QQZ08_006403 [Neonectria magnoliae]|uniref:Uncharacterized protein n=1 Tax=Neonectria magnoliae TaxID=2732573 RepID=A0ABR1I0V2_9HYPO